MLATRQDRMIFLQRLRQKIFGAKLDVRASWEQTPQKFDDLVAFMNWFDTTSSMEDCVARATTDWDYRFGRQSYFAGLNKGSALEIGFGGGRLLSRSARDFAQVYGVDIHHNFDLTRQFLATQNVANANLVHRDQLNTLPDHSLDFIYSFIVFQHFDGMNEVDFYLNHIKRLLSPTGISHIYFGKSKQADVSVATPDTFILRDCSLMISPSVMRARIAENFDVIDFAENLPKNPVTGQGESGQASIVFRQKA
jgi:hypothetical protein